MADSSGADLLVFGLALGDYRVGLTTNSLSLGYL